MKSYFYFVFLFLLFDISSAFSQQQKLIGTVYDYFNKRPLDAVTISTSSGLYTISDSLGKFTIPVSKKDTVWFSFLSKKTKGYPVDTISNLYNFEIALYVDAAWLPAVKVKNSNYKFDSLQNRQEYAKVFNFRKPGIGISTISPSSYVPGSVSAGLDLDEFINMFRFRRNRMMLSMQERLIDQEQEKYINHRYSKYLVQKLTGLKSPELDSFICMSKPSYELLTTMNEIELGYYVEQIYKLYKSDAPVFLRKDEEDQKN